jgi:hypothetical protein
MRAVDRGRWKNKDLKEIKEEGRRISMAVTWENGVVSTKVLKQECVLSVRQTKKSM